MENHGFHLLFDATTDGLFVVDEAGDIVLSNAAACHFLGYGISELTGLNVASLVPPRYRANPFRLHRLHMDEAVQHATVDDMELVALHKDGRELPVDVGLSVIETTSKRHVLVTLHDATRRRQIAATLQVSEERLQLAKRAAGLGVYDYDLITDTIHWDEHIHLLWGVGMNEPISYQTLMDGIHPDDRASLQASLDNALDPTGNGQYSTAYRVVSRNDRITRWVSVIGQVFFENGRAQRLVGVVRDITEQKTAEQKIQQQRNEMEALVRQQVAVQTASAVAHELNQPLVAISAYSESALHMLRDGNRDPDNLQHALKGNVKQAHRAGKTLHELLRFLHGSATESSPMYLNATVREAITMLERDGYGDFRPVLELEPDLPPVLGNRIQVQKVLDNLLRNGIEAMLESGRQHEANTIRVRTASAEGMALVTIRDSGGGLSSDSAKHIFEPFFTTKAKGIGMGLAISRSLIEALGGQLWTSHDAGPGATFHFTLPFAK